MLFFAVFNVFFFKFNKLKKIKHPIRLFGRDKMLIAVRQSTQIIIKALISANAFLMFMFFHSNFFALVYVGIHVERTTS